jgi:ribosomal protein S14
MGGVARGVFRDFRMGRVRTGIFPRCPGTLVEQGGKDCLPTARLLQTLYTDTSAAQFQFRMNALAGNLPGVKKASW